MERQLAICKILRTWEKATVALWCCTLLKKNLIHVVNYRDFFFLFLPHQLCAEGILAERCHNGHPAIPLLNELLLAQIDFRITLHRCLGVWVWGFFCLKMIVSLHFPFSFQACWNDSIPVIANVIQPCELWLILKDHRHFPPRRAPILLLLAVCRLPSAISRSGVRAAAELAC